MSDEIAGDIRDLLHEIHVNACSGSEIFNRLDGRLVCLRCGKDFSQLFSKLYLRRIAIKAEMEMENQ